MIKHNWFKSKSTEDIVFANDAFWVMLSEKAYPVTKGKFRIPISLEPFVIEENKYKEVAAGLKLLISACKKMAGEYFHDEELKKLMSINKDEEKVINEFEDDDFTGIIRMDIFYGDKPSVVEINSDFPDGFFMHDITANGIMNILKEYDYYSPNHAELFCEVLKKETVSKRDHVFIGYNKERSFIDEYFLAKLQLEGLGWSNVSVGVVEELDCSNGKFYFGGEKVDFFRRCAELSKVRNITGFIDRLIKAKKTSGLKIVNNFKMRLLGHKSLLAALHDNRFHKYLSQEEVSAVEDLVPFTAKIDFTNIKKIIKEKDAWVLKPSDLTEGESVFIGDSLSEGDWAKAMGETMQNPSGWIIQRKVSIPEAKFNWVDQEKIVSGVKKYDFNPHFVLCGEDVHMGNILVRFSDSNILNVAKGGGITYAFVKKNNSNN